MALLIPGTRAAHPRNPGVRAKRRGHARGSNLSLGAAIAAAADLNRHGIAPSRITRFCLVAAPQGGPALAQAIRDCALSPRHWARSSTGMPMFAPACAMPAIANSIPDRASPRRRITRRCRHAARDRPPDPGAPPTGRARGRGFCSHPRSPVWCRRAGS